MTDDTIAHETLDWPRFVTTLCVLVLAATATFAGDGRYPISLTTAGLPIQIASQGSYYLTEDIKASTTGNIIEITSSDVTLDLAGHTIQNTTSSGTLVTATDVSNIRVTNGQLVGGLKGLYFSTTVVGGDIRADHLLLRDMTGYGLEFRGTSTVRIHPVVEHCNISPQGGVGLLFDYAERGRVEDVSTKGASFAAAFTCYGCTITNSRFVSSNLDGVDLYGSDVVFQGNVVSTNGNYGVYLYSAARVSLLDNVISGNGSDGIRIFKNSDQLRIRGNLVADNAGAGVYHYNQTGTVDVSMSANTVSNNTSDGIRLGADGVTLRNNSVLENSGYGIHLDANADSCIVDGNLVTFNATCQVQIDATSNSNIVSDNRTRGTGGICNYGTGTVLSGNL